MTEERENKPVSPRTENIIKGVFLVLFSIVLALNIGKVGRTLVFVPLYLFGIAYYALCAFGIFVGGYRIFRQKKFKFNHVRFIGASIVLFFSLVIIASYAMQKGSGRTFNGANVGELLANYNGQLGNFYMNGFLNVFDPNSYWGGGLIGNLLCGFIANDVIVIFLGIVLFLLAAFIFVSPLIFKSKDKRQEKKAEKKAKKVSRAEAIKTFQSEHKPEVDDNPVISRTPVVMEAPKPEVGFENDKTPFINENSGFAQMNTSLEESFNHSSVQNVNNDYNEFTPLVFNSDNSPFQRMNTPQQPQPIQSQPVSTFTQPVEPIQEEKVEEAPSFSEEEEINLVESRPAIEEQPQPEVHQIDESLVRMRPQFAEAKVVNEEPARVEPTPAPAEEVKKKRERVVWVAPSTDILMEYKTEEQLELNQKVADERTSALNVILNDYRLGAHISGYTIGPSVTRFNVSYEQNVSSKTVEKYVQDISRRLGGISTRFAPVVFGEDYSGLEVPNAVVSTVSFKEVFNALPDVKKHPLAVAFGKNISGEVITADFNEFPHILVAGTTGSGKSIFVLSMISTLIMRNSPDDLKIVLVDPKRVEMTKFRDMPHLLCPIITDADKANVCLKKLCDEMNKRYEIFAESGEVSNIKDYNELAREEGKDPLPYIVVFIDEYADLVDNCKEISQPLVSIAQKARAAGIHLCVATQSPRTNIITGTIKSNIPTHVALTTGSYTDSIIIIGEAGAETLLGKGDMLVQSPLVSKQGVTRLQGCYIQNKEIVHIVSYLKEHYETVYDEEFLDLVDHSKEPATNVLAPGEVEKESNAEEEAKYQSIKQWVMTQEFVSMSKIQRECSVGFNRAGRFFTRLQKEGVVSTTQDGSSKGCKVLTHDDYFDDSDNFVNSSELIG